jgi:hypothetical protein
MWLCGKYFLLHLYENTEILSKVISIGSVSFRGDRKLRQPRLFLELFCFRASFLLLTAFCQPH